MTELIWEGKYDEQGRKVAPPQIALPFQTVETVNESTADRDRMQDLFASGRPTEWRNRLIWGDKKYVLPSRFAIEYTDSTTSLRFYEPDFVAFLADGSHRLIETKGREDTDVIHKDRAAGLWCENASGLTGQEWRYLKVPQAGFDKLQPTAFSDLVAFGQASRGSLIPAVIVPEPH